MKLYRIYCGLDTNGHDVDGNTIARELAAKCFPNGHTVYEAVGRWIGEVGIIDEPTIIVEYMAGEQQIADGSAHKAVSKFAGQYKVKAYQESVLVTDTDVNAAFV